MKLSKKFNVLLACTALLLSLLIIQDTYAKYLTEANGTTDMSIARWRILVNNQDIRDNSNISQVITPNFIQNEHIASNIIAPTSQGYFDIIIDCSAADVSFSYNIVTTTNTNSSVSDIKVTGYSKNGGTIVPMTNSTDPINETVLHSSNTNTIQLRIYIEWDDSQTASMNNQADTAATNSSNPAKLDVNLAFTQVA